MIDADPNMPPAEQFRRARERKARLWGSQPWSEPEPAREEPEEDAPADKEPARGYAAPAITDPAVPEIETLQAIAANMSEAELAALRDRLMQVVINAREIRAGCGVKLKVQDIIRATVRVSGVRHEDLISPRRHKRAVYWRQLAMFLCTRHTSRSLPEIGRDFGGRDHTTVLHARRKVTAMIETDDAIADDIRAIEKMLVHLDHRIPWSRACAKCNLEKSGMTDFEFMGDV